jgi:hypothetical protein
MDTDWPLLPNLITLIWIAPSHMHDATYFIHARIDSFHICLPGFPDIYYSPVLAKIPTQTPYLRSLRTFVLSNDTAHLWEDEVLSVQRRLTRLDQIHPVAKYDWSRRRKSSAMSQQWYIRSAFV